MIGYVAVPISYSYSYYSALCVDLFNEQMITKGTVFIGPPCTLYSVYSGTDAKLVCVPNSHRHRRRTKLSFVESGGVDWALGPA